MEGSWTEVVILLLFSGFGTLSSYCLKACGLQNVILLLFYDPVTRSPLSFTRDLIDASSFFFLSVFHFWILRINYVLTGTGVDEL